MRSFFTTGSAWWWFFLVLDLLFNTIVLVFAIALLVALWKERRAKRRRP